MKVAALDLGTNTFLMLIAEVDSGRITRVYRDELRVVRLGQGVHESRQFHPEALRRAEECFKEYKEIIDSQDVKTVVAGATSAARDVSNREEFFALGKRYGIPITIIAGEKEAELTFLGATFDRPSLEGLAVVDVGGGSTEVIGREGAKTTGRSVDVGSVRLTEHLVTGHPIKPEEVAQVDAYIEREFQKAKAHLPKRVQELIAVAGTPTTLAAVIQEKEFSESIVNGYRVQTQEIRRWAERLAKMSISERQALIGMDPKRADVIVVGSLILHAVCKALGVNEVTVSTKGVRYGLALSHRTLGANA